ncbi:MAG: patatin-like phospholipase family protein [Streptosporangiaceae bacterium]
MTTAFVLSGGGSLGAVQVGMLQALTERHHAPDLLVGTSAGAVNASYLAGHGTSRGALQELAGIWRRLRRSDLFPVNPRRQLLAVAGFRESMFSAEGLRQIVARHLPYRNLEDAAIGVHVVATNMLSGEEVLLSSGEAVSAVLASTAIPGLLPAVRAGLTLVDGALANNAAISQAVALGADRIFVLPAGVTCALTTPPASPYASALQALSFLTQQRLIRDVATYADQAELHVIPPLCPLTVSSADFSHAAELIDRARNATAQWLDNRSDELPHQERFLSLHEHQDAAGSEQASGTTEEVLTT